VRRLEEHINNATESNFNKILQRDIAVKDVRELVDLGFSEMATEVREVDSLVQKSAALLSDRKDLLRATGQVESVVNKFLGSLKQQAIHKQSAWKTCVDELVNQITKILHGEQYERDAATLAKALDDLLHYDASKCPEMIDQIKLKIDKYQSKGELDKLFKLQNFNEIAKRNRTVKKLKQTLASHLPELDEKIVHGNSQQLINLLLVEVYQEINRGDPRDPRYLDCKDLRKLKACLPMIRESFGIEADSIDKKLREEVSKKLEQNVQLVRQEVERSGRAMMTERTQSSIAKMLVKSYSMATELSMQSDFQDRIKDVLTSGLNDEGLFVIGVSLSKMSKGGDNVPEAAAESARTIIEKFREFKDHNIQLFNSKASVRCVCILLVSCCRICLRVGYRLDASLTKTCSVT